MGLVFSFFSLRNQLCILCDASAFQSKEHSSNLTPIPVLHLVYLKSLAILKPLRINCLGFKAPLLWLLPTVTSHRKEDLDINKWCCIAFSSLKTSFFFPFIYSLSRGIAYWNVTIGVESSGRAPWGFRVPCSDSAEEIRCFKEPNKLEGRECFLRHVKMAQF